VGNEQYDKLESALPIVLLHLLKRDHQPERRSRGWWSSIKVQRNHVWRILAKNPGLKSQVDTAVTEAYEDARVEAAAQTRLDYHRFPEQCPYVWQQILERSIDWPPAD
jgi:hypothetical protein